MKKVPACRLLQGKVKWDECFDSEAELLESMMTCKADVNKYPYYQLVKGYEYIASFQKQFAAKGSLTEKQMTQLKRLGSSIYEHLTAHF